MSDLPAFSCIVLAGGRSRRFGRDKLAEPIGQGTLLQRAVTAVATLTTDVVVAAAPGAAPELPAPARVIHDDTPFQGPLAGLMVGLVEVREPLVVVVGGDMPSLEVAVLELLVRTLDTVTADACALEYQGRVQPLPIALRTGAATTVVRRLLGERERRLGAVLDRLTVRVLADGEWRPVDPDARTLRDVDEPDDLMDLR